MHPDAEQLHSARPRHGWLYALPGGAMPASVACNGELFQHVETFKHDFFAATGLYRGPAGLAVLKINRVTWLGLIPMRWTGRLLCGREVRAYAALQNLAGVPRLIGRVGATGFLHAYVPGHPLGRSEKVSDTFFDELDAVLRAVHAQHMAYVDLNKRQNILMGDDGKPYLIDFQISLMLPPRGWRRLWPLPWLLARFQQADRYHFLKHKRRLRPDLMTPEEWRRVNRLSVWIRLHRAVAGPLTWLRRRILRWLHKSETAAVAGSRAK
ncbi:serine/threonine protein kinase [Phycisphaerae bacterium RAS1]|nr:serine/threonine protein kinase [Phycisphaerae bacterium RAS1]